MINRRRMLHNLLLLVALCMSAGSCASLRGARTGEGPGFAWRQMANGNFAVVTTTESRDSLISAKRAIGACPCGEVYEGVIWLVIPYEPDAYQD